jgi:hypothetical protein
MQLALSTNPYALARKNTRIQKIFALQNAIAQVDQWNGEPEHEFTEEGYRRTLDIPKGIVVVGKIHKHAHWNIIHYGHVLVYTPNEGLLELRGPLEFMSTPGTKRAVLALEDTRWTTVHETQETDLAKIEDYVIAKDYDDYNQFLIESNSLAALEHTKETA